MHGSKTTIHSPFANTCSFPYLLVQIHFPIACRGNSKTPHLLFTISLFVQIDVKLDDMLPICDCVLRCLSRLTSSLERSGSGVELRTLDYENPGSNPGCGVKTLGKFFSLYIAPVHSAELNEYLAIDSGGYVYEQPSRNNCSIWLDASQRSWDGVWVNRSVREVKCKALWTVLRTGYCTIQELHFPLLFKFRFPIF